MSEEEMKAVDYWKNYIEDKIDELTNSKEYFQMFPEDYLAKIGIEILEELLKDGGE
ncbi:MAG: hypothetical protein J6O41_01885 [Clostridia bacterium]|nr:hypothetical protein [Clostridia bacterium]